MTEPRELAPLVASSTPIDVVTAEIQAGMTSGRRFGPGTPMTPADGHSRTPRSFDYPTGFNISARPRLHERVSFDALRGLIEAYDVAQMCIWHRIDSIRSLDWALIAAPGHEADDLTAAQAYAQRVFRRPDRVSGFKAILTSYLYDVLAFDAGALYRIRNGAGQVIGFKPVDGTTIAPLLDYYGDTPARRLPDDPAPPAYIQFVQGIPWDTLTTDDLIYEPFRATSNSPYGRAPIETILLNANTDLRFQQYFLQRFTDGNIPHGFAQSPEGWSPDQIREFQDAWDAFMLGDQTAKQQMKWVPHGTSFAWTDEKEFSDKFSLFLMRKTAAAFHVTPQDLGFTEDVNRATSDTQADNQFRVGDLPLIQHVQGIFDSILQDDMGLPLAFQFDTGQEKEDRLQTAQANQLYVNMGAISVSEVREREFGLDEPHGQTVPRFVLTSRGGPIPLNSLMGVAGPIDSATGAPKPGAPLPTQAFQEVPGVLSEPPIPESPLAVAEFGPGAYPSPPPGNPNATPAAAGQAAPAPAQVVTKAAEAELASFTRFVKARRRAGRWRDFTFTSVDDATARRLNTTARADVRKAAGQLIASGLAVRAADTGRVLMLQRGYDPTDPARGLWEFPGGHLEDGEEGLAAAWREWQEETGCLIPAGATVGDTWASSNGIYQGWIASVPCEADVDIAARGQVINPDDPDGDVTEAIAWWDPALLPGNPAIRPELAADLERVLAFLTPPAPPAPTPDGEAGVVVGKAAWRDNPPNTPHAEYDLAITDHYAPLIVDAMQNLWTDDQLAAAVTTMADTVVKGAGPAPLPAPDDQQLRDLIRQLVIDALTTGDHAAALQLGPDPLVHVSGIDWDAWTPGDARAAALVADGGLKDLLDEAGLRIKGINDTTLERIGNRIADGLTSGEDVQTVARGIRSSVLGDAFRATLIAHTEMARAMTQSTLSTYRLNGIRQWALLTTGGACQLCLDVEARNPHDVTDRTDQEPPLHPLCRCAVSPVVEF